MLRARQPTYEVNFIERHDEEGGLGRRWVSAAVSGFNSGSSRHEQVEKLLGHLGDPMVDGDFSMRRMREAEVRRLHKENIQMGATPVSHETDVNGLTAKISYPEGEDLRKVRDERREDAASWLSSIELVQAGVVKGFALFESGLGLVTSENADGLATSLRAQLGPLYGNDQVAAEAVPPGDSAAGA